MLTGAGTSVTASLYCQISLAPPRFVSGSFSGPFLAGYAPTPDAPSVSYGLVRLDHAVGNTTDLLRTVEYIMGFTGGGGGGGWGTKYWGGGERY